MSLPPVDAPPPPDRGAALAGVAIVALNLVAVAALVATQPHAYKPEGIAPWLVEARGAPGATMASAWAFTLGLAAFVPFAAGLARRDPRLSAGAWLMAAGALLDAAGTMAPVAALRVPSPAAEALLGYALVQDAAFNALLGVGLVAIAAGMGPAWPRALRALVAVAGLASLPVAGQVTSDACAAVLVVAGPLWLAAVLGLSWSLARPAKAPPAP